MVLGDFHRVPVESSLVFFGVYCFLVGYLIFRSTFVPRPLGVSPPPANRLAPAIVIVGIAAEASLMFWLLAIGVNVERWRDQAQRSRPGGPGAAQRP